MLFNFYWNVKVLLQYCSFLNGLGWGETVYAEKRIWHFCPLNLIVILRKSMAVVWCYSRFPCQPTLPAQVYVCIPVDSALGKFLVKASVSSPLIDVVCCALMEIVYGLDYDFGPACYSCLHRWAQTNLSLSACAKMELTVSQTPLSMESEQKQLHARLW